MWGTTEAIRYKWLKKSYLWRIGRRGAMCNLCTGSNQRTRTDLNHFDGTPNDDDSDHSSSHHGVRFVNDDGAIYCLLYAEHLHACGPQPGGRKHHDSSAGHHHCQAKQCKLGRSVFGGHVGVRALPRLHVVPRTEDGARPLLLEVRSIIGHQLTPVAVVSHHPAARVEIHWGNPSWSRGGPALAAPRKMGPNITCKNERKGGRRGSRNGATKPPVLRPSETPRLARVLSTSHGDAHHRSTGPSWTLEWRLSASAYCHTRNLVHIFFLC
ncbi:uncharacterized protein LOC119395888 [Rhipicephalus sanguineus]|uniref:uncharacterized protein LOC119395888 n=1 Tax=Rhipicephalus sanguineus TaxID=34632 RepID=UPI0020C556A9|nr:uncharacterized protein LOC119395888 [Rhipicephalus sanguineus]